MPHKLEIRIVVEQSEFWSPVDADYLLEKLALPIKYHVVSTQFEPLDELEEIAELIEGGWYDQARDAISALVVIWGESPDTVKLSTRIERIRILGR